MLLQEILKKRISRLALAVIVFNIKSTDLFHPNRGGSATKAAVVQTRIMTNRILSIDILSTDTCWHVDTWTRVDTCRDARPVGLGVHDAEDDPGALQRDAADQPDGHHARHQGQVPVQLNKYINK